MHTFRNQESIPRSRSTGGIPDPHLLHQNYCAITKECASFICSSSKIAVQQQKAAKGYCTCDSVIFQSSKPVFLALIIPCEEVYSIIIDYKSITTTQRNLYAFILLFQ